ncbi:MAG: hypothetical protein R3A52_23285 [Polyangiales bacterium]
MVAAVDAGVDAGAPGEDTDAQYPAAAREFLRAMRIDPTRPDAWYDLGMYCLEWAETSPANRDAGEQYLARFVELAGDDPRYATQARRARWAMGGLGRPTYIEAMAPDAALPPRAPPAPRCAPYPSR